MEKEISSGTNLGIVLIALAAIIALGFGIFAIAKGTANEGVVQVQDHLAQVGQSVFNDFDQKIVTGTQVVSAYNNFAGKPYAILICTQAYVDTSVEFDNDIAAFNNATTPVALTVRTSTGTNKALEYLNYNALLSTTDARVYLDNGVYKAKSGFAMTAGEISFNNVIANMSKSGQTEYVPSGGRFQANLIKDTSGTIMGIAFRQVGVAN